MKGYSSKGRGGSNTDKLKHKSGYYCPKGTGPDLPKDFGGKYTDAKLPGNHMGKN
jgi:hypothetical protein